MNPHYVFALLFLIAGLVALVSSPGAADRMAKSLATHALRPNRSRWLDPILGKRQLQMGLRSLAVCVLLIALYSAIAGAIG
jgi:hypothetical protein